MIGNRRLYRRRAARGQRLKAWRTYELVDLALECEELMMLLDEAVEHLTRISVAFERGEGVPLALARASWFLKQFESPIKD